MNAENMMVKRNGLTWILRYKKVRGKYVPKWSIYEESMRKDS